MTASNSKPIGVRFVSINAGQAGQRIDNFLLSLEKGVPKSRIYRAIRKGEVRVNKGRVKQTYKLAAGDEVRVPPLRTAEKKEIPLVSEGLRAQLQQSILFEDDHLLVIDKPAGLAVHAGSQIQLGVIESLRQIYPELPFLELVHRLDRDTSGCLLLAKSRESLLNLQQQMLSDEMDKHYLTLLMGSWKQDKKMVELPLQKNTLSSGERMVRVDNDGKYAKTLFIPHKRFADSQLTEAVLFTGRTHQIRVHAAAIGHPIAGDSKYGDKTFNKQMKQQGLKRLFLHAWRLRIRHPHTGDSMLLEAPLPKALQQLTEQLETQ